MTKPKLMPVPPLMTRLSQALPRLTDPELRCDIAALLASHGQLLFLLDEAQRAMDENGLVFGSPAHCILRLVQERNALRTDLRVMSQAKFEIEGLLRQQGKAPP